MNRLEKIAASAAAFIGGPLGFGGVGYVAGGILGGSWDAAEIGGYIGEGLGLFTAGLVMENETSRIYY